MMSDVPNVWQHLAAIEHAAEECECAHLWLDDREIPRTSDTGEVYSLVGRISIAVARAAKGRLPL